MKIEIFEEDGDNTLTFGDEDADFTIDVFPESKTYQSRLSLKGDVYYRTEQFEYRIKTNPVKVETRLTERLDEPPPDEYKVKDGVVLESDILKRGRISNGRVMNMTTDLIKNLKKEIEWHEDWIGNPVSMYILSKHPEIISAEDYRRYLRQLSEKIKNALLKVEKVLESDKMGLRVTDEYGDGRTIWLSKSKQNGLSEEEIKKVIDHQHKIQERLFDEKSSEYVGVSESEFRTSVDILENIDVFLNKKTILNKNKTVAPKISKTKGIMISLLLTLLISWVVSWFVGINPFLIFILVQVISFIQSVLGGWLGKFFE